jgi:hypothetical protein
VLLSSSSGLDMAASYRNPLLAAKLPITREPP